MLKKYDIYLKRVVIVADAAIAGACFFLAYYLLNRRYIQLYELDVYMWILPVEMVLWIVSLSLSGMYASFRLKRIRELFFIVLRAGFISLLMFGGASFLFKTVYVSRGLILTMFVFTAFAISVEKIVLLLVLQYLRRRGFNFRTLLIVGTGPRAQRFIKEVELHREYGLKIVGLVDDVYEQRPDEVLGHRVIGSIKDIPSIICNLNVDIVVFIVPRSMINKIEEAVRFCETVGVVASVAVDLFNLSYTKGKESRLFGIPLLTFERVEHKVSKLLLKRAIDVALSATALILLTPVYCLIAVSIKLTSKGPVFYRQMRCGLNGRPFTLYKFRTMVDGAEAKLQYYWSRNVMMGPAFKMEDDPRVTALGKILRKTSLDELPQFWNVLKGEMSLVGPRPALPREVSKYYHWQRRRLSMRPGITCLWQVSGRNNIKDFNRWMKLDLEYIDRWSLWRDCVILFRTIPEVISTRGAK